MNSGQTALVANVSVCGLWLQTTSESELYNLITKVKYLQSEKGTLKGI